MVRPTVGTGNYDLGSDPARARFRPAAPAGGRVGGSGSYAILTQDKFEDRLGPPSGPTIGVVDTGLVLRDGSPHPWFDGHAHIDSAADQDIIPDTYQENSPALNCHGTFVSGRILLEAPTANIHMKGVLDKSAGEAEDQAIAAAISALAAGGVELINLSFCGDNYEIGMPKVIQDTLDVLTQDVVVVAAAGNDGQTKKFLPAAYVPRAMMIAVGAVDETAYALGAKLPPIADFSNHGAWVTAYSGGVSVLGPYRYDQWAYWSGTSFAAATVTGVIARTKIAHPDLTMRQAAEEVLKAAAEIPAWDANGRHESRYIPAKDYRKPPEHD